MVGLAGCGLTRQDLRRLSEFFVDKMDPFTEQQYPTLLNMEDCYEIDIFFFCSFQRFPQLITVFAVFHSFSSVFVAH